MLAETMGRGKFGQLQYKTRHLIHAFFAANLLHNRRDLQAVLEAAVKLIFAEDIAADLLSEMSAKRKFQQFAPSASTLSRHQLQIHASFLAMVADEHHRVFESGCSWFLMADSSPTAGQDWLNFSATYVCDQDLPLVLSSAHILTHLAAKEFLDDSDDREEAFSMDMLQRAVRHMYIPPAGLGSKRSSASHKFHCLVHALRLVFPSWAAVSHALRQLVSLTADLGPERLLVNIKEVPLEMLFGWALQSDAPARQMDAAVQEMDLLDHAQTQSAPPTPGGRDPSPEPMAAPGAAEAPALGITFDTSASVYIPGILHIIHNATLDLQRVMSWWGEYVQGLTSICTVLRTSHYRKRLAVTCFSEDPAARLKFLFDDESVNDLTVQENRWASVALATCKLAHWEGALRTYWDLEKFCFQDSKSKGYAVWNSKSHHKPLDPSLPPHLPVCRGSLLAYFVGQWPHNFYLHGQFSVQISVTSFAS